MAEGSSIETYADHPSATSGDGAVASEHVQPSDAALRRTLLFVAIAAASAGLAFAIVRATLLRPPADPTTERIQQLIDEANRLLAQLDDKKSER